ncbi:cysteine hydrolase family protein [Terrarubrum flagellatum]|uniref:cysteine hydrolase family protein n=1 Tax=Terrirubrum flagellatum TaxID=2895980 RepID=UPI0031454433
MQIRFVNAPTLVLIDIQKEYTTPGRPFFLQEIGPSLKNCRLLLSAARRAGARVIHVRHVQDGPVFKRGAAESDFVEGFSPLNNEIHLLKSKLSCYANERFAPLIDEAKPGSVYVAGYGSTMCCMATVAAAPLFGHKLNFIHDASWARSSSGLSEEELHRNATAILGIHGALATTKETIARFEEAQSPVLAAE